MSASPGGRADRVEDGLAAHVVGEAPLAARHLEARREALQVPLERAGERLVEVVQVEDEVALGRGEATEVREVRVTAELRRQVGARGARDVGAMTAAAPRKNANGETSIRP